MNKKDKERLFNSINLEEGFKEVLNDITNEFDAKYERIRTAEQVEIDNIKRKFAEKKKKHHSREKRISNELKAYLKDVEKYSTFKILKYDNNIMDILVDIVSLYKGEQYEYNFITDPETKMVSLIINPETMDISDDIEIDELVDEDIVLDFTYDLNYGNEEITFYTLNNLSISTELLSTNSMSTEYFDISSNSEEHKYILEFINLMVKYRMEKKNDDISFVELKRLEQAFIYSKKEEIEELNRKRSQEEREELEKKIKSREALLDDYINDNIDDYEEVQEMINLGDVRTGRVLKKLIERIDEEISE